MKYLLCIALVFTTAFQVYSGDSIWTMDKCMRYAIDNSPKVKKAYYQEDSYKADKLAAFGSFLPSISSGVEAQYNYGRSIDPKTNTYNNTSTFGNSYALRASMTVFSGGRLINQWKLAKVNGLYGREVSRQAEDELAINTMQAYIDVVFYYESTKLAHETLEESKKLLHKTIRMEELGLKGKADVAQVESQVAADDYNLTRQQNLYNIALLTLKEYMNYDSSLPLPLDTTIVSVNYITFSEPADAIYAYAATNNPLTQQAALTLQADKLQQRIEKSRLLPSISFYSGVSTTYFENLKADTSTPFNSQFRNNAGEYFGFSMSFTLFDRLSRTASMRKAKNNISISAEQQNETLRQLQVSIEKAVSDRDGYLKEIIQMKKQVEANSIVYHQSVRKFEEGLMSSLDLQINSNKLVESKMFLLQRKLLYIAKVRQVSYYSGESLIQE